MNQIPNAYVIEIKSEAQSGIGSGVWGATAMPVIKGLYRYPIKGLSAQSVERATIPAAKPFPFDRIFALARPGVPFDRANPGWAKKGLFIMLMLEEQLAEVETCLDIETMLLAVYKDGSQIASINLATSNGRAELERFVQGLVPTLNAPPQIVRSADGHFMDKPDNVISLINLATVRSLEQQWGIEIDPLRFRANIYIDDAAPWSEFEWIGNDIKLGDGIFSVDRRNGRCGATNVNPATGRRDLDIPGSLRKAFGHKDLGIYLVTKTDVDIAKGDHILLPDHLQQAGPSPQPFSAPSLSSYICRGCYFIYDEDVGFEKGGFPPRTPFSAIPADWRCPDCGTGKSTFRFNDI